MLRLYVCLGLPLGYLDTLLFTYYILQVFVSSCDFLTIVCDIHGICSTFFVCLFYFSFFKHFYKFTFFTFLQLYIYVNLQIVANYSAILYGNVESMLFMFIFNPWRYLFHNVSLNYFLFHQFGDDYQNILLMSLSKNQEVILYETPTSLTLYITSKKYKNELPHCL